MKNTSTPSISIIIPTLNEEKNIKRCLDSVFRQKYPEEKLEVIIVDDKSTDRTLEIAKKFPVTIIISGKRHGEISKMIGFRKAKGKYAIYLDADIELKGNKWFQKMIKPLEEDGNIIGSFTRYYSKKHAPAIERYLSFEPLHRDSIYQLFSTSIDEVIVEKRGGYYLLNYEKDRIPPAGLCMYRRRKLLSFVRNYEMFMELDFLVILVNKGCSYFAYVPTAGLYHHHVNNVRELLNKRKYNVKNVYLKTYTKKLYKWFDLKKSEDVVRIISWILYANLIIPSVIVGIYKSIKFRDIAGMYEPIVNLLVTDMVILSILSDRRSWALLAKD